MHIFSLCDVLALLWSLLLQGITVNSQLENAVTTSSSSSEAVVPVTAEPSSSTNSDVVPTSSAGDSGIHIVVDKQAPSDGIVKSADSSIHIVVDNKTSLSRVIRTMVSNNISSKQGHI